MLHKGTFALHLHFLEKGQQQKKGKWEKYDTSTPWKAQVVQSNMIKKALKILKISLISRASKKK